MKKAVPLHPQTGNDPGAQKEIIGTIKRETISTERVYWSKD